MYNENKTNSDSMLVPEYEANVKCIERDFVKKRLKNLRKIIGITNKTLVWLKFHTE